MANVQRCSLYVESPIITLSSSQPYLAPHSQRRHPMTPIDIQTLSRLSYTYSDDPLTAWRNHQHAVPIGNITNRTIVKKLFTRASTLPMAMIPLCIESSVTSEVVPFTDQTGHILPSTNVNQKHACVFLDVKSSTPMAD